MCLTRGLSYSARGFFRLWIYGVDKFEILLFNGIPNRPYKPYYSEISTDTLSPPIMTNRLSVKVSVSKNLKKNRQWFWSSFKSENFTMKFSRTSLKVLDQLTGQVSDHSYQLANDSIRKFFKVKFEIKVRKVHIQYLINRDDIWLRISQKLICQWLNRKSN